MSDKNCPGCEDREENMTDGCCAVAMDSVDGLPSRCVGDWNEDKHHYLSRYADIFSKGMKNKWPNLVYIDLFAGPGRCRVRPNQTFSDGSPLLALQLGFTHYFFVDMSKHCVEALDARVTSYRPEKNISIRQGDANMEVEQVVEDVKALGPRSLVFAFIDPPGIEIHWETIRKLSEVVNDFLILVPTGMNLKRQQPYQEEKPKDQKTEFDIYFGTPDWRGKTVRQLLNLYTERLRNLGYSFVGDSQKIKYWQKNVSLYDLVFASKNPKGAEFWKKITAIQHSGQRTLFG